MDRPGNRGVEINKKTAESGACGYRRIPWEFNLVEAGGQSRSVASGILRSRDTHTPRMSSLAFAAPVHPCAVESNRNGTAHPTRTPGKQNGAHLAVRPVQFFGGGGRNRTAVREFSAIGSTCLSASIDLTGRYPTGREDNQRFR